MPLIPRPLVPFEMLEGEIDCVDTRVELSTDWQHSRTIKTFRDEQGRYAIIEQQKCLHGDDDGE